MKIFNTIRDSFKGKSPDSEQAAAPEQLQDQVSPELDLDSQPKALAMSSPRQVVRLNKRPLIILMGTVGLVSGLGAAAYLSQKSTGKKIMNNPVSASGTVGVRSDAWYNDVKDFFVSPEQRQALALAQQQREQEQALAAQALAAGGAAPTGNSQAAPSSFARPDFSGMPKPPASSLPTAMAGPQMQMQMPPVPNGPGAASGEHGAAAGGGSGAGAAQPLDMKVQRLPATGWVNPQLVRYSSVAAASASPKLVPAQVSQQDVRPNGFTQASYSVAPLQPVGPGVGAGGYSGGSVTLQPAVTRTSIGMGSGVPSASPYELKAGWSMPGVLVTGLDSDIPGMLIGQVSQNVYDSVRGEHLLIPMGSKLIGTYGQKPSWGIERLQVSWVRLILPNGVEYDLSGMNGSDGSGQSGLSDQVDNHYGKLVGTALMMSVFGVSAQLLAQQSNVNGDGSLNVGAAVAASTGQQINNTAQGLLRRDMTISPTVTIRSGYRFNILAARNIVFNGPYKR